MSGTGLRGIGGGFVAGGPIKPGPGSTPSPVTDLSSLQVVDAPFSQSLVDAIVGDVAGGFFGN
ncbi:MAG: hypothetical protein HW391_1401 [Chloroflexi bacterium]|nr:hypothetical protein [Chloroflexota bacterium]